MQPKKGDGSNLPLSRRRRQPSLPSPPPPTSPSSLLKDGLPHYPMISKMFGAGLAPSNECKIAADQLASLPSAFDRHALRQPGGIPTLVEMLTSGAAPAHTQQQAVSALWGLAANHTANQDAIREAGAIPRLVALLTLDTPHRRVDGVRKRTVKSKEKEEKDVREGKEGEDGDGGTESDILQHVAGALWSLAANNMANQEAIRSAGGICLLVGLLSAPSDATARHAAGALRNLAADNPTNKKEIREQGGVPSLVALLHAGHMSQVVT